MIIGKNEIKQKIIYLIIGMVILSILFRVVVIAQPEGWILSGRIHMDERPDIAGIQVFRHGTNALVNSSTTDGNGSYSIKLPNGEYDIKVESYLLKGSYNVQYDTKTIVINNSNVTFDFKASGTISKISTIFFMLFLPVILPSIVAGFIMAILIQRFTKKIKTAVIGFVMGTVGTIIIDLLIMRGFNDKILAFLLSASITLTLVVISIILLDRGQRRINDGESVLKD